MLKILNGVLDVLLPLVQRLVKYHAKLLEVKQIDLYVQSDGDVDITKVPLLKRVLLYDSDIIDKRRDECDNCEFKVKSTISEKLDRCSVCKCVIRAKTRVVRESCPKGKWGTADIKNTKEYNGIRATA